MPEVTAPSYDSLHDCSVWSGAAVFNIVIGPFEAFKLFQTLLKHELQETLKPMRYHSITAMKELLDKKKKASVFRVCVLDAKEPEG